MKNLKILGKALNKAEQKEINGGLGLSNGDTADTDVVQGNWGPHYDGVTCFCDGVEQPCWMSC